MTLGTRDQGGVALVIVEAVLILCGSFLIALRVWAVHLKRRSFKIHDYLAFASLPFAIALSACEIIGTYCPHIRIVKILTRTSGRWRQCRTTHW